MVEITSLLERNLAFVFNERNRAERLVALQEVWALHGTFTAEEGAHIGRSAIDKAVEDLLRRYPELIFGAAGPADSIPGAERLRWTLGVPGKTPAATGEDVAVIEGGKIVALYRFLDGPAW